MADLPPRTLARALAALRIVNGLILALRPTWAGRLYLGRGAREPTARLLARFTGARDVVTGIGALAALQSGRGDVEIVASAAVCEALDATVALGSRGVGIRMRLAALTSIGAAVLGAWAALGLSTERRERSAVG
jgi:hypothetical protein